MSVHPNMSQAINVTNENELNSLPDIGPETQEPIEPAAGATPRVGYPKLDLRLDSQSRIVLAHADTGIAVEQYRLLRRNLMQQFPRGGTLLITSPSKGDGKTLNAFNLAWSFADASVPTLLVEADLRQPGLGALLGFRPNDGVESAFSGETDPESTVVAVSNVPHLHLATASGPQSDPVRLLTSSHTKKYLQWARTKFPWVILDCPPVVPAVDVSEISALCDAVLLVVRARSTPVVLVQKSLRMLNGQVLGIILNEASLCWDNSYSLYDKSYYKRPEKNGKLGGNAAGRSFSDPQGDNHQE